MHAGPEAAALDWYGPEAEPGYWQGGRGRSRIPGSVRGWAWGHLPGKNLIGISDTLRLILRPLQYITYQ